MGEVLVMPTCFCCVDKIMSKGQIVSLFYINTTVNFLKVTTVLCCAHVDRGACFPEM